MLAEERRRQVLQWLEAEGRLEVSEVARRLAVSPMTVRRDLERLEADGLLVRTHGGALPVGAVTPRELPYASKRARQVEAKRKIGRAAAALIRPGETVILDAGSTTLEIARHLPPRITLKVVTNDLLIARELADREGIDVYVTGGQVRRGVYSLQGPETEAYLRATHVDRAFVGADGIDVVYGVSTTNRQKVPVKQAMLAAAERSYVVADHSKLGRRAFARFAGIDQIGTLICDDQAQASCAMQLEALAEAGVEVVLAP
ncbi:DeoR/GlpR transcriptional regulator [Thermaerobacter sp. PB12/4term]|uniref:DeoR/GlpR family DNA-binding transcription regulator n=1 Tax=Thermaerobacter sp. PB12/4term TaxID=2293838 RepID=UPI000E3251B4|nr:DeoR/GlpR family DNA-binding transcription regulator [Thermaerobacter sp. PB12/4term]QIA27798.1 DeoR/GlpR transcriptional regulator [Thermaerobacter sp. PB12/4term]